ncbi:hypothetical protein [Streptomyces sp. NPDC056227]|uniref:hypothetical protein n=1 Tax=Streptomyces sp. NPDC056227 TaxID=3345753 RepID=UPI0035DECD79
MHSMSALAANATSAPAVSGWGLVAFVVLLVAIARKGKATATSTTTPGTIRRAWGGLVAIYRALVTLYRAVRAVVRFLGGRELRGEPRSTATFLSRGRRRDQPSGAPGDAAAVMAAVASAPPKVSLSKRQPSPWARKLAGWLRSYEGRGARTMDLAVRGTVATYKAVRAAYRVVAPLVVTLVRALRGWGCWPYAARGLARVIAIASLVVWLIPAWTTQALLVVLAAGALLACLGPQLVPAKPGDDETYGPRLWAVLSHDLHLPADEPREHWLSIPARLADPGARVVLRLPWTFRGSDLEKETIGSLINSRLPGEWVGRFTFSGEHAKAVYTHKPPAKPKAPDPEPPAAVDIWDPKVQEILAGLGPDEFYLGQDTFDQPVIQKMADEQAHWALSVGSGGGKSAMLQYLAIQMLMKRGIIVAIDPKMVSLTPLIGMPGVYSYIDPETPWDMRETILWAAEVVKGRNYEKKNGIRTHFEPLYVFLEECNELADLLKEEYTANKVTGDPAADPIWRDGVAKILRLGREVNVHIIAVFQDFKDTQFGGVSLVPLFPFKILGSYREQQWKRIMGASFPMPPIQKKAGRMVLVLDTGDVTRIQVPYVPWDPEKTKNENQKDAYARLRAYYGELRAEHGYSSEGLYEEPPQASPERLPAILDRASRDTTPRASSTALTGALEGKTPGGSVTDPQDVTPDVTGSRDRLRLVPGQAGPDAPQDPLAAPVLLSLAEIAREMQARGYAIEAGLMRQHKRRRESTGFPTGVQVDGSEKFTLPQLIAFYEKRGVERSEENTADADQGDAV